MIQPWKVPHLVRGMLTFVPAINRWRARSRATGGSDSARYCYAVWLRHLVVLSRYGFTLQGRTVCELGPGDSIGAGLAALLAGARRYIALDAGHLATKDARVADDGQHDRGLTHEPTRGVGRRYGFLQCVDRRSAFEDRKIDGMVALGAGEGFFPFR